MFKIKKIAISAMFAIAAPMVIASDPPDVDLQRAEEIHMGRCFMCHGVDGESSTPLYPRLAGQHYQYIARQLADFRSGKRQSSTMAPMVTDLSPEEMLALGVFFEKRPTRGNEVEDQALLSVGRFIYHRGNEYSGVAACATCHGDAGQGSAQLPRLASQIARYVENQLQSFHQRERTSDNDVMHSVVANMTPLEIKAVSLYVSSLD